MNTEDAKRTLCTCGSPLHYVYDGKKIHLVCNHCDRHYPLRPPPAAEVDTGKSLEFDAIDEEILKHLCTVAYSTPVELCSLLSVSRRTVVRRIQKLIKQGMIHGQRKNGRWFLFYTEQLYALAETNGWV